jgi:hypothetical protein
MFTWMTKREHSTVCFNVQSHVTGKAIDMQQRNIQMTGMLFALTHGHSACGRHQGT